MLEARDLNFGYAKRPILKDINITIMPNGITALIGPSGSGKTTLLRCLALLQSPESGEIHLDGEVYRYPATNPTILPTPWPRLTPVFQQLFLWPHLTLRQNIMLPVLRTKTPGIKHELERLIDAFDMEEFIDHFPNQSSLGQCQRAALARALLLKPRYLLLDEITSALDVEQIAKVLTYLKSEHCKDMGIFIITHLLGFARHAADQVLFMANGEIVEMGGPDILASPQTERLGQFLSVIAAAS